MASAKIVPLTSFQIEQGVPLPGSGHTKNVGVARVARALADAPIGSSVLFPLPAGCSSRSHAVTIAAQFNRVGGKGWFTTRTTPDGCRVWKVFNPTARS